MLIKILTFVFFFSGVSALIYQVAWQRLLTVYYGVGAISITLIVSVYMAGLGLGALWGGILAERVKNRLGVYCLLELLIGLFGVSSPFFLDTLGKYTAGSSYAVSFVCLFVFLLFPTMLMGMTLPFLTKIFNQIIHHFFKTVSFLYFINTLGAAIGTIVASYWLISYWGLDRAVYFAAGINFFLVACLLFVQFTKIKSQQIPIQVAKEENLAKTVAWGSRAYGWIFVTGFLAIGYEMVWFRVTSFLVKDSPYSFSSALSVYLFGIALGSLLMNRYLLKKPEADQGRIFFLLQFLIGVSVSVIFIAYFYATKWTPFVELSRFSFNQVVHPWMLDFSKLLGASPSVQVQGLYKVGDVFFWPFFFTFIPTLLMGATFPMMASLALSESNQEGRGVGRVYFFNILGNVLGGIVTGFVLLPWLGTERTVLVFCVLGILLGFYVLVPILCSRRAWAGYSFLIVILAGTILFFPRKGQLYEIMHFPMMSGMNFYFEEGVEGVVGTFQQGERVQNFIHGSEHGGRPGDTFQFQAIEALSLAPKVDNILIIGFGTGSTLEAVLKSSEVKRITLVELNQTLIKNLRKIPLFAQILDDPRVHLVIDDGRRYLLRTPEKYNLILMDPLRTFMAYSNNLYSHQFMNIVNSHLLPGGAFFMWADERVVILSTISSVFEYVHVYSSHFIASDAILERNRERFHGLILALWPDNPGHGKDLSQSPSLKYLVTLHDYKGSQNLINQDWRPCIEYFLGLGDKYRRYNKTADTRSVP